MTFDEWAKIGRSESMEKEHTKTVLKLLNSIRFEKPFSFLDVGCGNGWVVRKISQIKNCKKAVGIDKSQNMITNANSKKKSSKENYLRTDILSWKFNGKFDYIFFYGVFILFNTDGICFKKNLQTTQTWRTVFLWNGFL